MKPGTIVSLMYKMLIAIVPRMKEIKTFYSILYIKMQILVLPVKESQ
jgi:hypothetical protein